MQLLFYSLTGKFQCIDFELNTVSVLQIKEKIFEIDGLPIEHLRITLHSKDLPDFQEFDEKERETLPPFHILLKLPGGKGGFGSLLRGGPKGVTVKKTTNFDACRDLNGRRLRQANNQAKIDEWLAKEDERKEEQSALDYIKKRAEIERIQQKINPTNLHEERQEISHSISSGVQQGLQEILKRKLREDEENEDDEDEDEEEDEEEEEEEEIIAESPLKDSSYSEENDTIQEKRELNVQPPKKKQRITND